MTLIRRWIWLSLRYFMQRPAQQCWNLYPDDHCSVQLLLNNTDYFGSGEVGARAPESYQINSSGDQSLKFIHKKRFNEWKEGFVIQALVWGSGEVDSVLVCVSLDVSSSYVSIHLLLTRNNCFFFPPFAWVV